MCQVQDGSSELEEMKGEKQISVESRKCMKCGEAAVVIARVKDAFCRNCFLVYFTHRFKATIGKSRLIRDKEKVLIAFSGGQNSSAVLRLVHAGRSESQHKKFRFIPSLVYIDDGIVTKQTPSERKATRDTVTALMKKYDIPSYIFPLEEYVNITAPSNSITNGNEENVVAMAADQLDQLSIDDKSSERLLAILDSAKSLTAKEDLVNILRHRLLAHIARLTGHTKVMLGVNGTQLAASVLSGMALGRGVTVPLEVGFADNREGDSSFVRPLREFPSREIALYNQLSGVDSVCIPTLTTKAGQYASINKLTSDFIHGLQTGFPSTVSTVLRTGEKLCTLDKQDEESNCAMCKAPLDTTVPECSALVSTQHSLDRLSATDRGQQTCGVGGQRCGQEGGVDVKNEESSGECCGQGDGSCHSSKKTISAEELSQCLCYGCRITVREMRDTALLPSFVLEEAGRRQRRSQMKNEIQDFLLPDGDR